MVKRTRPVVVWNNRASIYFRKAYEYIKAESHTNAEKVKEGITKMIDGLPDNPAIPSRKVQERQPGQL